MRNKGFLLGLALAISVFATTGASAYDYRAPGYDYWPGYGYGRAAGYNYGYARGYNYWYAPGYTYGRRYRPYTGYAGYGGGG